MLYAEAGGGGGVAGVSLDGGAEGGVAGDDAEALEKLSCTGGAIGGLGGAAGGTIGLSEGGGATGGVVGGWEGSIIG